MGKWAFPRKSTPEAAQSRTKRQCFVTDVVYVHIANECRQHEQPHKVHSSD